MKQISKKYYYLVVAACGGLAACALGLIPNVNGIFFSPVSEALGVSRGEISFAATLTAITTGLMGPVSIKITNYVSLKKILIVSIFITAMSTVLMALSNNIIMYDLFSVIRGASSAFFGIPVITFLMGNWFVKRRGMFTGIVMSCSGIVGAILSPILSQIIQKAGYQVGYYVCAALMIVFAIPGICLLVLSPKEMDAQAYGAGEVEANHTDVLADSQNYISYKGISMIFAGLCLIAFMCQSVCSVSQHLAGFAESIGQSSMIGALMLSVAMIGNIVAKFLVGLLCDYLGAFKSVYVLMTSFLIGLLFLNIFQGSKMSLLIGAFLLGTSYACALMISNITFALYGTEQYGKAFSILTVVLNIGGSLAIAIVGYGYDLFKTYSVIMWSGIGVTIFAMIVLMIISINYKKEHYKQCSEGRKV